MKIIIDEIDNLETAFNVIVKGADGVGIKINEKTSFEKIKDLIFYLPPISSSMLKTSSVTPIKIVSEAKELNVNTLLLTGDILLDDIALIREKIPYIKIIKKIEIIDNDSLKKAIKYKKYVDAILIETDIMDKEKLIISQKIIDECDYVLLKSYVTLDYLAVIKELTPYGIIIDYKENLKLKEFIKAIKE